MPDRLLVERDGVIVTLTLNDPGNLNIFSPQLRDELADALTKLNDDPDCRAIVLTGAGGVFTAGGDIRSFTETTPLEMRARLEKGSSRLMRLIVSGRKPIVAAVEGTCYGAGISLAAACDYFVVAADSRLCCAFMRLGFLPDLAAMWSLPRRVGLGKAKELIALAPEFSGRDAFEMRLADQLTAPGQALAEARKVAERFARMPPVSMAILKSAFSDGLEAALKQEIDLQPILAATEDHAEAKAAFLEKRSPVFKGR